MATLDKIKREHKKIFNDLSIEEKKNFYKKLSEIKFNNYPFFTEEGKLTGSLEESKSIDNLTVELNSNPNDLETFRNASLSVLFDYIVLKSKYNEELLVAFKLYFNSLMYNEIIIDNIIYFLESFLAVFEEEPSELLYYCLQDGLKATGNSFRESLLNIYDVINNAFDIAEEDVIEELPIYKKAIEDKASNFSDISNKILDLEKPEGAVEDG